jgi:solute carrier family 26 (sodium-independent sulfate anion transporter), member 11
VLSTLTGNVVLEVAKKLPHVPKNETASVLALISGCIVFFIGFVRLGWIVDLISLASIAAYMSGSAINIAVGQVPALMGITGFSNRDATYIVVIHILKHLGRTTLDAAIGLTALTMLYVIRIACSFAAKRFPSKSRLLFFVSTLRVVFVILLYTLISWLVNRHHKKAPKFAILGAVPRGFTQTGAPTANKEIIRAFSSQLPAIVIVMLIEHISISKSFGRVNNYIINPSQELVAIGISNILGPFLGAYPATGSFSRTAIKSKAGVRTPLGGVVTAIVVLIAIYGLNAVFYYIPNAALSAVIIHAVLDLITPPKTLYQFWKISPLEVPIFLAGVLVTVFSSIENGIYVTVAVSAALYGFRLFKAQGRILGRVRVHTVVGDETPDRQVQFSKDSTTVTGTALHDHDNPKSSREAFLPIDHGDGSNPAIEPLTPYPGIIIFRFSEGYNYPNAIHYTEYLTRYIFANTRRTNIKAYARPGVSFILAQFPYHL